MKQTVLIPYDIQNTWSIQPLVWFTIRSKKSLVYVSGFKSQIGYKDFKLS